jgi:transposase
VLAEKGGVQLAFFWAHVRRRFYELAAAGPAPIASEVLERIAALYKIEAEIQGRPAEVRRLARQERSLPILDTLEPFLRGKLQLISQKTKLAEAIRYALSRWEGLICFAGDGRIEIDNNTVERSMFTGADAEERPVRRLGRRRRPLGRHRPADRNLQASTASIPRPTWSPSSR